MRLTLIAPSTSIESVTAVVTRPPARATTFRSVPKPKAAIDTTVRIFATVAIGA